MVSPFSTAAQTEEEQDVVLTSSPRTGMSHTRASQHGRPDSSACQPAARGLFEPGVGEFSS